MSVVKSDDKLLKLIEEMLWMDGVALLGVAIEVNEFNYEMNNMDIDELCEQLFIKCYRDDKVDELAIAISRYYSGT